MPSLRVRSNVKLTRRPASLSKSWAPLPEALFYYRVRRDSMFRQVTREKFMFSYKYILERHKPYYTKFASQIINLLNANGPGYQFDDELPARGRYEIGSLAMANAGPNTNGSQFFIISGRDGVALPPSYSLFGKVVGGTETISAIESTGSRSGAPSEQVTIESVTITESD